MLYIAVGHYLSLERGKVGWTRTSKKDMSDFFGLALKNIRMRGDTFSSLKVRGEKSAILIVQISQPHEHSNPSLI